MMMQKNLLRQTTKQRCYVVPDASVFKHDDKNASTATPLRALEQFKGFVVIRNYLNINNVRILLGGNRRNAGAGEKAKSQRKTSTAKGQKTSRKEEKRGRVGKKEKAKMMASLTKKKRQWRNKSNMK